MTKYIPVVWDIETTGLNPLAQSWHNNATYNAQVTAVAWDILDCNWQHGEIEHDTHTIADTGEYTLLGYVRDELTELEEDLEGEPFLVGWNTRKFDHPYIGARYARLRQDSYPTGYGWKRLDMMRAVKKQTGQYYSEDDYAEEIGIETEPVGEGSEMPRYFKNGNLAAIREHVTADIKMAAELFVKDRETMMSEFYDHYNVNREARWEDKTPL